ncbi:adenosylcobinamide-GDP ribazoletransferase [Planktotalea sp.]|uniref:adenosylcobinamide-GDP ribazoletransferase n=1 Tax=Planktotalea sp. TaxID=2029877 RepID=UPI0025FF42D9|nr:adenosylcobinamide-GDP ribazoletransferase [Planktotalea sp.]
MSDKVGTTLLTPQNDYFRDSALALSLLTRLPIKLDESAYARSASAAWAYPMVGLVTGLLACIAAQITLWLSLPLWAAAIAAIGTGIIITGAMHEDGLADCADGFWGGWDPAMRLKIMQDSQIGTYGVLALLMVQGMRFGAVMDVLRWDSWAIALIAIHVASRAVMPMVMTTLPHARDTGLSRSVGKVSAQTAWTAAVIGIAALFFAYGIWGLVLSAIAALAAFLFAKVAQTKIGGQTGDVCGASQQITEVTLLLAILAR